MIVAVGIEAEERAGRNVECALRTKAGVEAQGGREEQRREYM